MNPLLLPVATNFLFSKNDVLSFIFSLKPLLLSEGDQYLKKPYFCLWKPSSLIFSDTNSNGSSLLVHWNRIFPASGNEVFIKCFIATSVYGSWVNFKPCAFIQSFFFCCWKALLKLGVNQFSPIFSVTNSGSSFSG